MKKTILFLVNHEIVIYNFRKEIVENLIDRGHRVIISSPKGPKIDRLKKLGCEHIETKIYRHGKNPFQDVKLLFFYNSIMKKYKPDVILSYTIKPNIYGSIISKFHNVQFIANITGLGNAVEGKSFLQHFLLKLYKFSFSNIQTVFFQNSENMNFFLDNGIALGKHKLLAGSGVNLKQFSPIEYPPDDEIQFTFISRIMKEKGINEYLEAAKILKLKYNNITFHVCGFCEENYIEILTDLNQKGIIKYHGLVDDIRDVLKYTHCTVHPTFYPEGISNVLLESASCARPIITTNRAGTREVVDNNINGYLILEKNVDDLVEKLEMFINLPKIDKEKMGINGRNKMEKEFNREKIINAYLCEIEGI